MTVIRYLFQKYLQNSSGKSNPGELPLLVSSYAGYADLYGSNLTLASSTSSAVGFTQDNSLVVGSNLLNISQKSSRSSSMSRYSN